MGEETTASDYNGLSSAASLGGGDDARVLEWEIGLPSAGDLTPLSQSLIPPELASAFRISPELFQTSLDVHRASEDTFSTLRCVSPSLKSFPLLPSDEAMVLEEDDRADSSAFRPETSNDDHSNRTLKRPRLVWTPQLHKRFVDVVAHLGIKNAVPKTIMQLMNVEGLSRENVASHLQKYRLYLKRMHGLSNEGPSSSDPLFASTPVPQSLHESPVPMTYSSPPMMPMPVFGMAHHRGHQGSGAYHGYEFHHPYGVFGERPRDWSDGNKFGS